MSVVAFDGNLLAADRAGNFGGCKIPGQKLFLIDEDTAVAFTGSIASAMAMLEWVKHGCKVEQFPDCNKGDDYSRVIICKRSTRSVFMYEKTPYPSEY